MRKQFVNTIKRIIDVDEKLVLLLGDIGVFGFREVMQNHPTRAYNIGILEQATIGLASGLSIGGYIPVVHTIAPFLVERAYEQLKIDFGYQKLTGNFVTVGASYDYAALGCTHHCPADVVAISAIPESQIFIPGNAPEFDILFDNNYQSGFNYYRLSEKSHRAVINIGNIGTVHIRGNSPNVVLVVGPYLSDVLDATKDLDTTVIYINKVKPFNIDVIRPILEGAKHIITVEPYYRGVLANQLIEYFSTKSLNISQLGVPLEFLRKYGSMEDMDRHCQLDIGGLHNSIRKIIYEK